jgi:hypothetical protein
MNTNALNGALGAVIIIGIAVLIYMESVKPKVVSSTKIVPVTVKRYPRYPYYPYPRPHPHPHPKPYY